MKENVVECYCCVSSYSSSDRACDGVIDSNTSVMEQI